MTIYYYVTYDISLTKTIQLLTLNAIIVIKQASATWENELRLLIYASFFYLSKQLLHSLNIMTLYRREIEWNIPHTRYVNGFQKVQ